MIVDRAGSSRSDGKGSVMAMTEVMKIRDIRKRVKGDMQRTQKAPETKGHPVPGCLWRNVLGLGSSFCCPPLSVRISSSLGHQAVRAPVMDVHGNLLGRPTANSG